MASVDILKATAYLADPENLQAVFKAASQTSDLDPEKFQILDADTVKLPVYQFGGAGLPDYIRQTSIAGANAGYTQIDLIKTWETFKLTQHKGAQLVLDVLDDEESKGEGIIKWVNEFTRQRIVPTVDKYRLSVLATSTPAVTGALTNANIWDVIDVAFEKFTVDEVPLDRLLLYVSAATYTKMKRSAGFTQNIIQGSWGNSIDTNVSLYNGAKIVVVKGDRLPNGVNFILVASQVVTTCVKYHETVLYPPKTVAGNSRDFIADWNMDYDLFTINKGAPVTPGDDPTLVGIYVHTI